MLRPRAADSVTDTIKQPPVERLSRSFLTAAVTAEAFSQAWYVAVYVVCMIALALHLAHGIQSSFRTMGGNHPKYMPLIKTVGLGFSVIVPLLFAAIPVIMLLNS